MPLTIKTVDSDHATDGRRLVRVIGVRQNDDASEPELEAVFHVTEPDGYDIRPEVFFLQLLSLTRTDTRETPAYTEEEFDELRLAVSNLVACDDGW